MNDYWVYLVIVLCITAYNITDRIMDGIERRNIEKRNKKERKEDNG